MKRLIITLAFTSALIACPVKMSAQRTDTRATRVHTEQTDSTRMQEPYQQNRTLQEEESDRNLRTSLIKSTTEETNMQAADMPDDTYNHQVSMPWMGYGLGAWDLHDGLNAQVGAGVRVGWGKHNPWRGASFFTDVAAMYCLPVSKDGKWTAAVGGYFSNYRLWGQQVNSLGIVGLANYRINERMDVSGFIMHDFGVLGGRQAGAPLIPFLDQPSTTIGAQLGINVGEKARVEIGVSFTRQNSQFPYGTDASGRPCPPMRGTRSVFDPDF